MLKKCLTIVIVILFILIYIPSVESNTGKPNPVIENIIAPTSIGYQETTNDEECLRPPFVKGFIWGKYTEKYNIPGATVFKCDEFDIIIFGLFYFEHVISCVEIYNFYGLARNGRIFGYSFAMLVDPINT
jgi:hypothetical protein